MQHKFLLLVAILVPLFCLSQEPGTIDISFNPEDIGFKHGDGFNGAVYKTFQQADGKIIVLGNFSTYNDLQATGAARLNLDGTLDTSFNSALPSSSAYGGILQPDGKILVRGSFNISGQYYYLLRLNNDGSLDNSFTPTTTYNITDMAIQSDGKYVLIGQFTTFNGMNANKIVRLNTDGSVDTSYATGSGFDIGYPQRIDIQADNKAIISCSGNTQFNNQTVTNSLARINTNGTLDTSFNYSLTASSTSTIRVLSNGQILVSRFTSGFGFSGSVVNRIHPDGSLDNTFPSHSFGMNSSIFTMEEQTDGKVLIAGNGYNNGVPNYTLVRKSTNGTNDTTFPTVITNQTINSIVPLSSGEVIISGQFTLCNGEPSTRIAKLTNEGVLMSGFEHDGYGINGSSVTHLVTQPDAKILIAGSFHKYKGETAMNLLRINPDGTRDTSFSIGTGPNVYITDIKILSNGTIAVSGGFNIFNDTVKNRLVFLNSDGSFNTNYLNLNINSSVTQVIELSNGKLLITGSFTSINGQPRNRIALLNGTDGSLDTSTLFGSGFNNQVSGAIMQADGKLLVHGYFTDYNGTAVNRIARLNTDWTLDTGFTASVNNAIYSAVELPNNKILLCGFFTEVNGSPQNYFTRLNSDGSIDTSFQLGTGFNQYVSNMKVVGNQILVGGQFTSYNGAPAYLIARLNENGDLDTSFAPTSITGGAVNAFATMPNDRILIGGYFTHYDGVGRNRLALIYGHDNALSVSESELENNIKIYPNPVSESLSISAPNIALQTVEIFNLNGQILKTFCSDLYSLPVGELASGMYLLKVTTTTGYTKTLNLIKK